MATKIADLGIGTAQNQPVSQEKLESIAQGWQPIETCPKDGTEFLICGGELVSLAGHRTYFRDEYSMAVAFCSLTGYYTNHGSTIECPTFWMPLPAPPPLSDSQTDAKPAGVHPPARVTHLGAE